MAVDSGEFGTSGLAMDTVTIDAKVRLQIPRARLAAIHAIEHAVLISMLEGLENDRNI